jgi:phosphopentomutase
MSRVLLIVLDSVGIGGAEDAAHYGDEGADTVGHIAQECAARRADKQGVRSGALYLPNLASLGLIEACTASTGRRPPIIPVAAPLKGLWGYGVETSVGKDTPSGHYEIAGVPVLEAWGTFPNIYPAFPPSLTNVLMNEAGLTGLLANSHASGTQIIDDLGELHIKTGYPIIYTSVDSVVQIAAHEEGFGLERLYNVCRIARRLCDPLRVGRVIARPFIGSVETGFKRTGNRRDFAMPPPAPTLLDHLTQAGRDVITVGKIGDIFAHRGTGTEIRAHGNDHVLDATLQAFKGFADGGLVFANLLDFDTEYGHRRDVLGYAHALESFDKRIPDIWSVLKDGDTAIITADHGNDPTWQGTDHTREHVPILIFGSHIQAGSIGRRETLADISGFIKEALGMI